jgi:hypothetical protein
MYSAQPNGAEGATINPATINPAALNSGKLRLEFFLSLFDPSCALYPVGSCCFQVGPHSHAPRRAKVESFAGACRQSIAIVNVVVVIVVITRNVHQPWTATTTTNDGGDGNCNNRVLSDRYCRVAMAASYLIR